MAEKDIRVSDEEIHTNYEEDPWIKLAYRVIEQAVKDFKKYVRVYRFLGRIEDRTEKQSQMYREAVKEIGSCERFFTKKKYHAIYEALTGVDIEYIWTILLSQTQWKGLKNE